MEDDGPIADACKMPSFIGSFDEGRVKLSRNLPTETSPTDGGAERPVGDSNRRVAGADSRLPVGGGEREPGERSGEEERDAEGNNNNNCNGGGERRSRAASAVEIFRRNLGVSKSPSLRVNPGGRMQRGAERESRMGNVDGDVNEERGSEHGDGEESDRGAGDAGTRNEPAAGESRGPDACAVKCRGLRDGDGDSVAPDESFPVGDHVYCTVYCIADDGRRKDAGVGRDGAVASDASETDSASGREEGGSIPEPEGPSPGGPAPYTLGDLVDPFGDIAHHLYRGQAGAESAKRSCRVCLEDKPIVPLSCCRKAVCDECLKLYVSSQVGW